VRPQTLRGRVTGVTIEGRLPVRFREPAAWLREFAVHTPDALALRLGGSLATGPVDEWSDLDACIHVVPGTERRVFDALLSGLDRDWVFTDRWVLEPPVRQEGLQVFGRLAHEPGGTRLVVDVEVEAVPDGGVPIDPRRHGVPIVLHDPDRLIRVEQDRCFVQRTVGAVRRVKGWCRHLRPARRRNLNPPEEGLVDHVFGGRPPGSDGSWDGDRGEDDDEHHPRDDP